MSLIDFNQEARDQGCLHIALKPVGGTVNGNKSLVSAVGEVLRAMPPVQIPEPKGTVLFLRFIDGEKLPNWASNKGATSRWEQFSAHKSVLGLLCIAQCHDADDLDNIRAGYKSACSAHQRGLCGSKCIVYGSKKNLEACMDPKDGFVYIDSVVDELDVLPEDTKPHLVEKLATELAQSIFSTLRSRMETRLKIVMESSRGVDPLPLLKAPVEAGTRDTAEDDRYVGVAAPFCWGLAK